MDSTAPPSVSCADEEHADKMAALVARKANRDPFIVSFAFQDKEDPRHFREVRKWAIITIAFVCACWANVISSVYASGVKAVAQEFGVSELAARVPQAIYLYGFACGPVVLAPLSEDHGRWPAFVPSFLVLGLCQLACALAPNLGVLIFFRYLGGFCAAATFNSVGQVDDLWETEEQSWPTNSFAIWIEVGASLGPIFGGYLFVDHGWRWLFGVSGIGVGALLIIWLAIVPETRAGVLLSRRAARIRKETGDSRFYALHEKLKSERTLKDLLRESVFRPVWMLFTEPIVFWFALFDGYNYAIVYIALEGVAHVYSELSLGNQGLPFVGLTVGFLVGFCLYSGQQWWEKRAARRTSDGLVPPEERLAWGVLAGILFPISLFYFAWTSYDFIPPIVSIIALGFFGVASHAIFICVSSYTITSYGPYAASAVAAQSFLREFLSGSVTLFAAQMYDGLGNQWASSLLAFLALPLATVPYILYKYGSSIRARSAFAKDIAAANREAREQAEEDKAEIWSREQTRAPTRAPSPGGAEAQAQAGRDVEKGPEVHK